MLFVDMRNSNQNSISPNNARNDIWTRRRPYIVPQKCVLFVDMRNSNKKGKVTMFDKLEDLLIRFEEIMGELH